MNTKSLYIIPGPASIRVSDDTMQTIFVAIFLPAPGRPGNKIPRFSVPKPQLIASKIKKKRIY